MKRKTTSSLIILLLLIFVLMPGMGYCALETLDDSELSKVDAQALDPNNSQTGDSIETKDGVKALTYNEGQDRTKEAESSKPFAAPKPANDPFGSYSFSPNQGGGAGGMLPDHSCCR